MPSKKTSTTKPVKTSKVSKASKMRTKENYEMKIEVFYMATIFIALCGVLLFAINNQSQAAAPTKATTQTQETVYRNY